MPVYGLSKDLIFPHPSLSNKDGLLAVGGDLSIERLLLAYENGIFPWYEEDQPILWWSPNPRFILYPKNLKVSKSMEKVLRKTIYKVTFDTCFRNVITMCGKLRSGNTWITEDMIESYCDLHQLGFAHSIEAWFGDELVGGLYGVSLGKCFFGESMFSTMDNASKTALITLTRELSQLGFHFIDCQVYTKHLESLGAVSVSRDTFLQELEEGLTHDTLRGIWHRTQDK
ncbi:leucyl/phenylalanyl-tRNA--protein transferase [Acetivibrio cellulolyticus]|uniref:leucyl/phenylalanyl-tRNA--protein transferase n=1 Tax=Acetivibrio cellulolyticus TaxID=35830 RepID=UPI0001E2CCCC|nr:leucyl/phenylalanyl-tRNA--protein transferase [Acetivibrio cellulolyticus]